MGCGDSGRGGINPENIQFDSDSSLEANVDNYINTLVSNNSPGIAIGVIYQGEQRISKGYGLADIDNNTPISNSTPFYLASVSKQFFSMGVLLLEEQGLLSINDRVNQYFPEFPSDWSDITIHYLLSHQSGVPDYFRSLSDGELADITNIEVLEWAVQNDLNFSPGVNFNYSNTGYVILSLLIERVSQTSIETFMENNIYAPLGMSNTLVYDESKPNIPGRAIGYSSKGNLLDYNILTTGGGGIYSTIEDLFLWSEALDDYLIVEKSTFESAITTYRENYGYGWIIEPDSDNQIIFHSGGLRGFRTFIFKDKNKDMTVVMLSNGELDWLGDLFSKIVNFLP